MTAASRDDCELDELRLRVEHELPRLVEHFRGSPTRARGPEWRWGSRGSLRVFVSGPRRGRWQDFEAGDGRLHDGLDFIRAELRCDFPSAVEFARSFFGTTPLPPRSRATTKTERSAKLEADVARKIRDAQRIFQASTPVRGTLAETYLLKRGIPAPAWGWPDSSVRFHVATRSLIVAATTADGELRAIQRIYLIPDGCKVTQQEADARGLPAPKVTNGCLRDAAVRLPRAPHIAAEAPVLVAEGPETALSLWTATGYETVAVLGVSNFPGFKLSLGASAILCQDDDRRHGNASLAVKTAVATWRAADHKVAVATPWPRRRFDGSDFNDLCRAEGLAAVRARVLAVVSPPRPPAIDRVPVEIAREEVDSAVRRVIQAVHDFDFELAKAEGTPPPVSGVGVTVGVGKTTSIRANAVEFLIKLRRAGDKRTVTIAVPTHKLATEQERLLHEYPAFAASGLTVATWRGRRAADPNHPDFENPTVHAEDKAMCRDLQAVSDAHAHSLPVQQTACRRTLKNAAGEDVVHECSHFQTCAYQAQLQRRADLWIVPHDLLFTRKPAAIGNLAFLAVDESAWQSSLEGVSGHGDLMPIDMLRRDDRRLYDEQSPDSHVLQHHRRRVLDALDDATVGPIMREAARAGGMTAVDAAEARAITLNRLVRPEEIVPGMPRAERLAALKAASGNKSLRQMARFWRAMADLLADGGPTESGAAELAETETQDGPQRVIRLRGHRDICAGWEVPTVVTDALLNIDLARHLWPQIQLAAKVEAAAPHQHIRQLIDRSNSLSRLEQLTEKRAKDDPVEDRRRRKALGEVKAIVCREARKYRTARVLVVLQKTVKEALVALGPLPCNVVLAHYGAVAGRDEWRDVGGLILVGRPAPAPHDVEDAAMALTGAAVRRVEGWYDRVQVAREMADGSIMLAEADRHPDPIAEAVRAHICEGGVLQAIGRPRGVNRGPADPVDVLVLTDTVLPVPIDQVVSSADLAPSAADRMLAERGIAFTTPRHAADAYPQFWRTWETAKSALREGQKGENPNRESITENFTLLQDGLRRLDYQRAGARQSPAVAWYDPLVVDDPAAALMKLLGPLAWCRVDGVAVLEEADAPARTAKKAPARPAKPRCSPPPPAADDLPVPELHVVEPASPLIVPAPRALRQTPLLLLFVGRGVPSSTAPKPSPPPSPPRPFGLPPATAPPA